MMIATAVTRAMKVIGPWLSATMESHNVALLLRPWRRMLMIG